MTHSISHDYRIVDEALERELEENPEVRSSYLFLEEHQEFKGHWSVQAFDGAFFFDFKDLVGPYRVVAPSKLGEFLELADELGYQVAFFDDPLNLLRHYEALNDEPDVEIRSSLPGTVKGLLPYQVGGFNKLRNLDGGVALWSTGTGKTVLANALISSHLKAENHELVLMVVKAHNKVNTQRSLKALSGLDSVVIDGTKKQRLSLYRDVQNSGSFHKPSIAVLNYEKFRTDKDELKALLEGKSVLIIWDEMPTKLKTRTTQLYKAVCECLYRSTAPAVDWQRKRPSHLRQYMLSATPIENNPEDFFNCVRLLDPRIYGTVNKFRDDYVARYSYFDPHKPDSWHNLDKMGLVASHIVHQVDKDNDPEIRAQFPEVLEEPYYIDWDSKDRKIYDLLTKQAGKLDLDEANVLALIGVMQMLCNAPSMVTNSAAIRAAYEEALAAWEEFGGKRPTTEGSAVAERLIAALGSKNLTDERHTKLETLRELLCEDHPNDKVLVFSAFNEGIMPILEAKLKEWKVSYVRYNGTAKQKQEAQDEFMTNPKVQVFLTSDMGSDSLSLEQANVVIHYDLPWKWSTYIQRQNRVHRVDSDFEAVRYYSLLMANSIEDRKREILQRKFGFHEQVFQGAIADQAASGRMSREDLIYVLTGDTST